MNKKMVKIVKITKYRKNTSITRKLTENKKNEIMTFFNKCLLCGRQKRKNKKNTQKQNFTRISADQR